MPAAPDAVTRAGDLWELGRHRLLCADATDPEALRRLMGAERAEVLWTDPPYGVGYVGKTERALRIAGDAPGGLEDLLGRAFAAAGGVLGSCSTAASDCMGSRMLWFVRRCRIGEYPVRY